MTSRSNDAELTLRLGRHMAKALVIGMATSRRNGHPEEFGIGLACSVLVQAAMAHPEWGAAFTRPSSPAPRALLDATVAKIPIAVLDENRDEAPP